MTTRTLGHVIDRRKRRESGGGRPGLELALAAATIGLIFGVAFLLPQPLWNGHPAQPPAAGSQTSIDTAAAGVDWAGLVLALAFGLAWTLPFRPYALAIRLAQAVQPRVVLGLTAVLAVVALLIFPGFGSDVFIYVDYARLWAIYGEHPLLAPPIVQPGDWAFQFVWLPNQPSPYGPLWAVLTWPIARLADTSVVAQAVGYKILALGGYVACGWLIWTWPGLRSQRARAFLLFAWSPLVLFETLAKAHNDVLLALSALLALRLSAGAGRLPLKASSGIVAAVAGGLVKATGLAVLPSVGMSLLRRREWLALGLGVLAASAVAIGAYVPFWRGPETLLPILAQTSRVVWSPGSLAIAAGLSPGSVRVLLAIAWAAICALTLWRVQDVTVSATLVLLATMLLLTTAFFAHYLVPVIALAAVSGQARVQRAVLALSIGAMATYAVELLNAAFGPSFIGSPSFQIVGSLVLLVPALIALLPFWSRQDPGAARAPRQPDRG